MIEIRKKIFVIILTPICFGLNIQAQATYSPYSMLGLGEIENRDYGRTAGMSNIGIGVRDFDYLNVINPAGITKLDSLRFIYDLSVAGRQSYFTGKGKQDNAFNANMKKIALGFRMLPGWGISLGIKPFSDTGYQIYSEEPIEGSINTKSVYLEGSGGLYQLYLSNGIKITDYLSIGVNTKYIRGTLKQTENQSEYLFEKESRVSQFYNTFGLQYHKKGVTVGATYGYKQNISMKNKMIIYNSGREIIQEQNGRLTDQFIPETFGLGFSSGTKKIIWGMDFEYQKWKGLESGISSAKIVDSYSLNAGLGYTPKGNRYYKFRTSGQIQVGGSFSKSYIHIGGKDAYNYSVSAGYSLPVYWNLLNISLEYGNSLSAPSSYIRESYLMVTLNCSIIDEWFNIRRFE
ncbi:hypothetical protein [Proteiniphilum sp.]|uniref:hypothetical protein n=1 Tax=Proteiniphilum sp. TaxID=1926877 RepID=UPI002B202E69|nr:hypothetical protein [Proteiniphilum sp.]MEA4918233.1 hypothetical protein [Proteiniphilum sp.]